MKKDGSHNTRRLVLALWLQSRGGMHEVVTDLGLSPSIRVQILQFFRGHSFGARAARNLERQLNMSANFLDSIPRGYETALEALINHDLHAVWNKLTGNPGADLAMIDQLNYVEDNSPPENEESAADHQETSLGIPPIQVSRKWLNQNISNFDCVKDFCIVTKHVEQDRQWWPS